MLRRRLGMARVAAEGYGKKAVDFAHEALRQDPKFVEAHEFLAFLALEDERSKLAAEEAQKALGIVTGSLGWHGRSGVNGLVEGGRRKSQWIRKVLQINPNYGEAYATGAHFLVINRRYEEGIRLYRKALELDPSTLGRAFAIGNQPDAARHAKPKPKQS